MILLSSLQSPLTEFPPNVNENVYAKIISFGLRHSRGVISFLLNLLVKREQPVQEKDSVRIAFIFSIIAHTV